MKRLITKTLLCGAVAAGLFLVVQGTASAAITGNCVTCHTMHNSQNGANMGNASAQDTLLRTAGGCLGCHQDTAARLNTNAKNAAYSAPIIYTTDAASTAETAAGNFFWVNPTTGAENKGHSVIDVDSGGDTTLTTSPGGSFTASGLTCTSCHNAGGHHTGGSGGVADGTSTANSYRFLTGGIKGVEDADWEYTKGNTDHNVYYGSTGATGDGDTISDHCALCHGNFHGSANVGGTSSPWTRHPTDIAMPQSGEYDAYNTYNTQAPVASTGTAAASATVDGTSVVMCLSCHRAHASDEPDMLRWSYGDMDAGGSGTTGCFVCHTTK